MDTKKETVIDIDSRMTNNKLPNPGKNEYQTLSSLLHLIQQIAIKFDLDCVAGRFNIANPNTLQIRLGDSGHRSISGKKENQEAVEFLNQFGVTHTKESHKVLTYMSTAVITFDLSKCNTMLEALNLLATPAPEEHEAVMRPMC